MSNPTLLDYVIQSLADARGNWPEISKVTEVPYHTISKIASGATPDPGVRKIETLAAYFRSAEKAA